jgi:hypothetical protein
MYKEVGGYLPAITTICYSPDNGKLLYKQKIHPPMATAKDEWILHGCFRL